MFLSNICHRKAAKNDSVIKNPWYLKALYTNVEIIKYINIQFNNEKRFCTVKNGE